MKILVLNTGSSSLKYQLIDMEEEKVLAKGNYERIGENEAFLTHKVNGEKYVLKKGVLTHSEALGIIISELLNPEYNTISSLFEISGVGHRIVHGGEYFSKSVLIDEDVISKIEKCAVFAPLHNPAAVKAIRACIKLMPDTLMVATFDTSFHQSIKKENFLYSVPYEYYEKYRVRKYGAHGTSHSYVAKRVMELVGNKNLKVVTCHLGQGASISAVDSGKCVDTSMGLTPLGGIAMVTRSGDLDPSVVTYIMEKENLTPMQMESILNKKSGISSMCGLAPDFRQIEEESYKNAKAALAINVFVEKVAEYIARYAAKMEGIDTVVFTGGIGENQINVRYKICEKLKFLGIDVDEELNNIKSVEREITKTNSKVKVYVIPTDEEMVIAKDTLELIK